MARQPPAALTPAERHRLAELLGKLLNQAYKQNKLVTFHYAWKLLYGLGAHVVDQEDEFWIITNPPGAK